MLLEARGVTKEYTAANLFTGRTSKRALDQVDFAVEAGTATALVGSSGSGKSTLARCLAGLEKPDAGTISYRGAGICGMTHPQAREYRRKIQLVFQDAASSINPRFTAAEAVSEPLRIVGAGNTGERRERAIYWMEQVELQIGMATRPALELSGGERQRLAMARALAAGPEVVIFDESFSALDPPLAARLVKVLDRLRESQRLTYVFAGHNLSLLGQIASEVAMMCAGRIVERRPMEDFLA
ncbi:MAG: ABC transporter ATP-binding protein, partial [Acidobacteriia bacterium]|nr:ABC transporter ATP-binding protein [Terriglobia bacterium]